MLDLFYHKNGAVSMLDSKNCIRYTICCAILCRDLPVFIRIAIRIYTDVPKSQNFLKKYSIFFVFVPFLAPNYKNNLLKSNNDIKRKATSVY